MSSPPEELAITRQAGSTPRVETNPQVGDSEPFGRGGGSCRAPALRARQPEVS